MMENSQTATAALELFLDRSIYHIVETGIRPSGDQLLQYALEAQAQAAGDQPQVSALEAARAMFFQTLADEYAARCRACVEGSEWFSSAEQNDMAGEIIEMSARIMQAPEKYPRDAVEKAELISRHVSFSGRDNSPGGAELH